MADEENELFAVADDVDIESKLTPEEVSKGLSFKAKTCDLQEEPDTKIVQVTSLVDFSDYFLHFSVSNFFKPVDERVTLAFGMNNLAIQKLTQKIMDKYSSKIDELHLVKSLINSNFVKTEIVYKIKLFILVVFVFIPFVGVLFIEDLLTPSNVKL